MDESTQFDKKVKTDAIKSELPTVKSEQQGSSLKSDINGTSPAASKKERSVAVAAKKFDFVDGVASFHATAVKKLAERRKLVTNVGCHRRALCARRDLAVRRALCKVDKV